MDSSLKAGIYGFILAFAVNVTSPVNLYFLPSFLAALLVTYFFRLSTLKDGLVAAFITYIFNDGVLNTLGYASFYFTNEQISAFTVDVWTMLFPIVSAASAVVAAYVGVWLANKRKPTSVLPSLVSSQPQSP
jgi:hypothetical protein